MILQEKYENLKNNIKNMKRLAVAFSGGVDSTFLLKVAHDILKENVIAITVKLKSFPEREYNQTIELINSLGVAHKVIQLNEFNIAGFVENSNQRCYYCKKSVFKAIIEAATEIGIDTIADGSNLDDNKDYRPGSKALLELGVSSPLKQAGLTKKDIREISKELRLPTWDKPAYACLASRIPYEDEITAEKLEMIEKAENYMFELGFTNIRVRHHGSVARIEVPSLEKKKLFNDKLMEEVYLKFKSFGFSYAALDLIGYRTGSMNEQISVR